MTATELPALLKPEEVARELQISKSKVYSLIAAGRIPSVRLTGSVRVPRRALNEMIEADTNWPSSAG